MNTLLFLANFFPYGTEEPYLEEESKYYLEYFDKVYVCSLQLRPNHKENTIRQIDDRIKVIRVPKLSLSSYLLKCFVTLSDRRLYEECWRMIKEGSFSYKRFIRLYFSITRSHCDTNLILSSLRNDLSEIRKSNLTIYSYRFDYQPYVGILLQRNLGLGGVVSRAHGFDLYEERRPEKYIPLRRYLLSNLNMVFPVSTHGVNYLLGKYPDYKNTIRVERLGTKDYGAGILPSNEGPIRLISVSTISSVKRLHLIVESLSKVTHTPIEWEHFGDGQLASEIIALCKTILPPNIKYSFHGHIQNYDLLNVYSTRPFHFFINVSSSEGIPVSIMEAMSFGIPSIATNVGGTSEIVSHEVNGYLLSSNFSTSELANFFASFEYIPRDKYMVMRQRARSDWNEKYNAEKNYRFFMENLVSLASNRPN